MLYIKESCYVCQIYTIQKPHEKRYINLYGNRKNFTETGEQKTREIVLHEAREELAVLYFNL